MRWRVGNVSLQHVDRAASVLKVVHQLVNALGIRPVLDFYSVDPLVINLVLLQLQKLSLSEKCFEVKIFGVAISRLLDNEIVDNVA